MCLQLFPAIVSFQIALSIYLLGRPYPYDNMKYDISVFEYLGGRIPSTKGWEQLTTSLRHDKPFSCGEMKNISYPFKLQGTHSIGFPLICHNNTLLINLNFLQDYEIEPHQGIYHVKQINFFRFGDYLSNEEAEKHWIQIVDPSFASNHSANNFCLKPRYPTEDVSSLVQPAFMVYWLRCRRERVSQLHPSCQIVAATPITYNNTNLGGLDLASIWGYLHMGFRITLGHLCFLSDNSRDYSTPMPSFCPIPFTVADDVIGFPDLPTIVERQFVWMAIWGITVLVLARVLRIIFIAGLLVYKLKQKYYSSDTIDKLLQKCHNLMPRRYSYANIVTGHFRDKIGQGGFGSVFKGSLLTVVLLP